MEDRDDAVTVRLTPRAAAAIKRARPGAPIVRLSATPAGCCSSRYEMALIDRIEDEIPAADLDGVRLVVEPDSLFRCRGVVIDYQERDDIPGFLVQGGPSHACVCRGGA